MSEPKAVATGVEEVVPGVWYWGIHDERIDAPGSAHAVSSHEGTVLIDPLPLAAEPMGELGAVSAICLTTSSHQRSSWRLRSELGVHVWAPALVREIDEEPDERYAEGDVLPGGLEAIFTPDLFAHMPYAPLGMVPAQYMHDPEQARRSAGKLLELDFSILCLGHGRPVTEDPHGAIRAALAAD